MSSTLPSRISSDLERVFAPMDRLFESLWSPMAGSSAANSVPLDVYERDDKLFVRAAIPGVKPEEVEVSLEEGVLTISGETKHEFESDPKAKVYRREYRYGKFARSIRLPENVDAERISARFDNGFVTIEVPRSEERRPPARKIPVQHSSGQAEGR